MSLASKLEPWQILAAILMPDHLHALVAPTKEQEAKLGNFSAALKRWMRQELKLLGSGSRAV
jgi:REP element-mobilizing transposase RayT